MPTLEVHPQPLVGRFFVGMEAGGLAYVVEDHRLNIGRVDSGDDARSHVPTTLDTRGHRLFQRAVPALAVCGFGLPPI